MKLPPGISLKGWGLKLEKMFNNYFEMHNWANFCYELIGALHLNARSVIEVTKFVRCLTPMFTFRGQYAHSEIEKCFFFLNMVGW